ncbi:sodium-dependent lysophosphatidylcholine symporter 1-like isoform X3 [Lytechinus variegatus]|uniref:sodium-dependent lysophosphatidylcholine symporter 1-like isoform X2 n=1 Tax=Lytechinus variegatus TaxID=7654 RepID=UPI001BB23B05|nr:sodium-dependent lysophosphatidylcholine symporter 1-like isoform X2 [Lytechinus variegatus]XP_041484761.1 sodium-dependent lysophosphatidylcholine symporter 1-like isoform X3 [Lytechinus variegatus]
MEETTPLAPSKPPTGKRKSRRLKVREKICYGLGGMPYQLTNTVIGFYISVFLLDTAQIKPSSASAVIFAGRFWDAITDPFVGYLVMKTDTRFGKLKPWMLFGAPAAAVLYFFIWFVPEFDQEPYLMAWYLLFYCGFGTMLSLYYMPYSTLTFYLTESQAERDSATLYRMVCEVAANLLGNLIMGQTVLAYTRDSERPICDDNTTSNPNTTSSYLEQEEKGYSVGALCICIVLLLSSCCTLIGTTEKKIKKKDSEEEQNFWTGLKMVLTFKPYLTLMISFLCLLLSVMTIQGNYALFIKYAMEEDNYQNFIIVIIFCGFALMPLWQLFLKKFGKKAALYVGTLANIPMFLGHAFLPPGNTWALYVFGVLAGNAVAVVMLVPWSMVPDVIDDFVIKTGSTYEAVFYSFFVMFTKMGAGCALAVSTLALGATGYESGACEQPESVALTLRLLVSAVPVGCTIVGFISLAFYPITEEQRKKNKTILEIWRDDKDERRRTTVLRSKEARDRTRSIRTYSTTVVM